MKGVNGVIKKTDKLSSHCKGVYRLERKKREARSRSF